MTSLAPRCPYCGSSRLVWDDYSGFLTCANCGAMIEPLLDDHYTKHYHILEGVSLRVVSLPKISPRSGRLSTGSDTVNPRNATHANDVREKKAYQTDNYSELLDSLASSAMSALSSTRYRGRSLIAVSYYTAALTLGVPHKIALSISSEKSGLSKKYIEKLLAGSKTLLRRVSLGLLSAGVETRGAKIQRDNGRPGSHS